MNRTTWLEARRIAVRQERGGASDAGEDLAQDLAVAALEAEGEPRRLGAPPTAAKPPPTAKTPAPQTQAPIPPPQVFVFDPDSVEGSIVGPDGEQIRVLQPIMHSSLIEIRRHFVAELVKTMEDF